jgi:hypothetical protein
MDRMSLLARSRAVGSLHVENKFTLNQSPMELIVEFEMGFSYEDFGKAVDMLKKATEDRWYEYSNPVCYYREPANVYYRNKTHVKTEFQCKFFYADNRLAYTPSGRSGWYISDMSYHLVQKIVVRHRNHEDVQSSKEIKREKLWKRVSKARYDEQTWSSLTKDSFREDSHPFFYIKKVFDFYDMERIKRGFENKEKFHIHVEGKDRHWTAEGKACDDGVYRAWFSSEYSGCLNGDYYYLLNPTTAVFSETD